jgi:MFS family permease
MKLAPAEIRAVIALAVGMFCVQVDFFALNLALPRMAVDLNETTTNMQWVISAYMIAVGAAMIPGGRLGDLRGHRRMVVAGLAVFGGASLVCGLSFLRPADRISGAAGPRRHGAVHRECGGDQQRGCS